MAIRTSAEMQDSELRGIVLRKFYDRRREGTFVQLRPNDFDDVPERLEWPDVYRACDQLREHGLIEWEPIHGPRHQVLTGAGKITAHGADVIEGKATSSIAITVDSRSYTFNQSHHNIIGDKNVQIGDVTISDIAKKIDDAAVSPEQKKEARGIIARAFEQPAVANVLAAIAKGVTRAFKE